MKSFVSAYDRVLHLLLGASVAVLIVPVTIQVLARYTALFPAWIWTEEMARFLFIWIVMLGAMIGVREGTHFEVDVWPELAPRANALLRLVSYAFILAFALVFVWYGIRFVQFGWDQTSELAEMPMTYIFIAWPLTGITWLIFGLERMASDLHIIRYGTPLRDVPPPAEVPVSAE